MGETTPVTVLGGLLALTLVALALKSRRVARLSRELKELKVGLEGLKEAAKRREYRIERYDALWFATVSEGTKGLEAAPGRPYCKSCIIPLAAADGRGEWRCPKCQASLPASLGELHVVDSIRKLALAWHAEANSRAG